MSSQPGQCPYIFQDEFERQQCDHPVYKDHGYCVFHSDKVEEKANDFYKAIAKWIVLCTQKLDVIDMRGFIVPEMKLEDIVFQKPVDFRSAEFKDNLLLQKIIFAQGADFSHAVFHKPFVMRKCSLHEEVKFTRATFEDDLDITGEQFDSNVAFDESKFLKTADFSQTAFLNNCDFRKAFFSARAVMKETRFAAGGEFSEAVFANDVDFTSAKLDQSSDFRGTQFKGDALFPKARFSELASFWMSTFGGNAVFTDTYFAGNVIFWMCNFTGIADFRKASFHQRAEFKGATFHNEIMLNQSRLQFLKELDAKGVNMEGTILNASHFWGVTRLENYSFQEAFLLSNNFAGKEFADCDFTGATFDSVHTKDWKLDEATIRKTRYIFTALTRETELDEYGQRREIYRPREDSRIPVKGNFNEGPNEGFTIADVFKQWKKKFVLLEIPAFIHDAFIQFFSMFGEYGRLLFQEDILARSYSEGANLRIELLAGSDQSYDMLDARIAGFLRPVFADSTMGFPPIAGGVTSEIASYRLQMACEVLQIALSKLLEEMDHENQDALLNGLRNLVRDWSLLSNETADSDANLDAYLIEMFRTDHHSERPKSESDVVPVQIASHDPADIDMIIEVKFSLDDLEHALVNMREAIPELSVKINGIQREITRVRDEREEDANIRSQQTRIAKIVQRTASLLAAHPDDGSGAMAEVNAVCRRINELITA